MNIWQTSKQEHIYMYSNYKHQKRKKNKDKQKYNAYIIMHIKTYQGDMHVLVIVALLVLILISII